MDVRHFISVLGAFFLALSFTACSETDDTVEEFPNWKSKNEAFFTSKYNTVKQAVQSGDNTWKIFKTYAKDPSKEGEPTDYILVKVLEEGTGSGCPLYTDTVRAHYRGQLLASTTVVDKNDSELGMVFDSSWSGDVFDKNTFAPTKLGVAGVVEGFSTALQHMHIGDRWRVYIPYQLGYKDSDNSSIPAYSTLVFDVMLAAYYRPGQLVPNWTSNNGMLWEE